MRRNDPEHLRMTVTKSGLESNHREPRAVQALAETSAILGVNPKPTISEVPHGNATTAEHCGVRHPHRSVCRGRRWSHSCPSTRWCHDDEHHRIALADCGVVLEQPQGRGVGQIIAARGVRGYMPTSVECGVAVAALRLISAGGTFVPAGALRSTAAKPDDQPEGERQRRSDGRDLTPRELSVIDLLREGKPNKLIAARLDMQESTVKVHVRNILKKLNAANRTHAAFVANRLLAKNVELVALPNSLRPLDEAQSPGTPKAVGA